jgi:hypothetical protein
MNASSVKITRLTSHQVDALEAGYAAGYIEAAVTKTTADWFNGITPSRALAQVKNFQAELKAQHGARGGHYQALHAVANKLVKLMETWVAPETGPIGEALPMPADAITFADEAPVKDEPAEAPVEMYATPMASYKPAPRGIRVLAGTGATKRDGTDDLDWTLELPAKTTGEARQKMQDLLDPEVGKFEWAVMQVGLNADWVTLDMRDRVHAYSSHDHLQQDAFAHLVASLGTTEQAEAMLALMGADLGDVENWAAEHRRHNAFAAKLVMPVTPTPAKLTATQMMEQAAKDLAALAQTDGDQRSTKILETLAEKGIAVHSVRTTWSHTYRRFETRVTPSDRMLDASDSTFKPIMAGLRDLPGAVRTPFNGFVTLEWYTV